MYYFVFKIRFKFKYIVTVPCLLVTLQLIIHFLIEKQTFEQCGKHVHKYF